MVSRQTKRVINKLWILVDASKFTQDLRCNVERVDQNPRYYETCYTSTSNDCDDDDDYLPTVTVETLEKGFLIKVFSERSCPGLLVSMLEAIEELGLELLDARVSCSDCFHLQAVGDECERSITSLDDQVVRQALLRAINNWNGST